MHADVAQDKGRCAPAGRRLSGCRQSREWSDGRGPTAVQLAPCVQSGRKGGIHGLARELEPLGLRIQASFERRPEGVWLGGVALGAAGTGMPARFSLVCLFDRSCPHLSRRSRPMATAFLEA